MLGTVINTILNIVLWFVLSGWAIAVLMLIVVPRRQRPDAARTWLLLILFVPWLGFLIYLFIGENRLPKDRHEKHKEMVDRLKAVNQKIKNDESDLPVPEVEPELTQIVSLAEHLGHMPVLKGNHVELIPGYDNIIDRLIEDIDTAEHHVHLLFYIIADDETGHRVTEALVRAVARGVKCRVLVDSFGALPFIKKLGDKMVEQGIELHYILPISLFRRYLTRIDLRNHRKIAVFDGQVAYTGSQNIVNADYGYDIEGLTYEELMLRLTGPIVLELQAIFVSDWHIESGEFLMEPEMFPPPTAAGTVVGQALPSGPTYPMENFQRMVVALAHHAKERIVITTPYFIPDDTFIQAMQIAVSSGVEVVLIVSAKVDQAVVGLAQSAYYQELLEAGVRIHIFGRALLHAKHMSVDNDIALIGSGNMDKRSFELNFEISMLFYDEQVAQALHSEEARYMEHSEELNLETWMQRSGKDRFLQDMSKLISPLL